MNAPAGLYLAKIIEPETGTPRTVDASRIDLPRTEANVIDAAAHGALQGVHLAINVAAMLIAFVALVALCNAGLGWAGSLWGQPGLSLPWLLGQLLRAGLQIPPGQRYGKDNEHQGNGQGNQHRIGRRQNADSASSMI